MSLSAAWCKAEVLFRCQTFLKLQEFVTTIRGESSEILTVLPEFKELYFNLLYTDLRKLNSFVWQLCVVLEPFGTSEKWEYFSKLYSVDSKHSAIYAIKRASADIIKNVTLFRYNI